MNKAPCKDCPYRKIGCHSTCEKYIAFSKKQKELNELRHKDYEKRNIDFKEKIDKQHRKNKKYWY